MSFQNPRFRVLRRAVTGMEGMHSKMFDPPTAGNLATPESIDPTNPPALPAGIRFNPVFEIMAAKGLWAKNPPVPLHTLQIHLMHNVNIPTNDVPPQNMEFFIFNHPDGVGAAKDGTFPAPTLRMPRGAIFRAETTGAGPPPHTIHWHGFEPTPMNDGVGHCSMELGGAYIYQWQPNFIGSYFFHCHRNTVQHFEFGLYGFYIIDPPDAFFASILSTNPDGSVLLNSIPVGNGRPEPGFPLGRRRCAANLVNFPQFGQTAAERVPLDTPDPLGQFPTDPHAFTVPYQSESIWVLDDRDINWSNLGKDPRATFPVAGSIPGVNDNFNSNAGGLAGPNDFFAFNDYRSTHFYVTGVHVPGPLGGTGTLGTGLVIPPELMAGVEGVRIDVAGRVNTNILLRILCASYNNIRVTFPIPIVIIAWDGRALGVPPFGAYNAPVLVPANTPIEWSVARRFECLIRQTAAFSGFASVEFLDTRGRTRRFTLRIPINITV